MKNFKSLLIVVFSLCALETMAQEYDFSAANNDGKLIYYRITSDSTVEVGRQDVYPPTASYNGSVVIPDTVSNNGTTYTVTAIGASFGDCSLNSVTIPNTVTTIGNHAFANCNFLTTINFGNSITEIEDAAFYQCKRLPSVTLPHSVISIGVNGFRGCEKLASLTLSSSLTTIGKYAFAGCDSLESVTIPASVVFIDEGAFAQCNSLTSIAVKTGNAHYSSPDGVLFNKTQNTLVCLPAGRTGSYVVPNSVTTIAAGAFYSCSALTSVTIGNAVTEIQAGAFSACTALASIYIKALTPPLVSANYIFNNVSKSIPVHVPCGTLAAYQDWGEFTNITDDVAPEVALSVNDDAQGSATLTQANTCSDDEAEITATPVVGSRFVRWNDGNTDNPRTVTVTKDTSFLAEFAVDAAGWFYVSAWANDAAFGTVTGAGSYEKDSSATLIATPNTGYRFVQWNDGVQDSLREITVISDTVFTAQFERTMFIVDVQANDATMGTVTGSGYYDGGNTATLIATPRTGYRFTKWNDDVFDSLRTITVISDTTFIAYFVAIPKYWITVAVNDPLMGSVTGDGEYLEGSVIPLTATPNAGYRFVSWQDGFTDNTYYITVTADATYTATFEADNSIVGALRATPLQVYPNPAHSNITISLPDHATNATFVIYDMQGRTLLQRNINSNKETISVVGLSAGVYTYSVLVEGQTHNGRLNIVR